MSISLNLLSFRQKLKIIIIKHFHMDMGLNINMTGVTLKIEAVILLQQKVMLKIWELLVTLVTK